MDCSRPPLYSKCGLVERIWIKFLQQSGFQLHGIIMSYGDHRFLQNRLSIHSDRHVDATLISSFCDSPVRSLRSSSIFCSSAGSLFVFSSAGSLFVFSSAGSLFVFFSVGSLFVFFSVGSLFVFFSVGSLFVFFSVGSLFVFFSVGRSVFGIRVSPFPSAEGDLRDCGRSFFCSRRSDRKKQMRNTVHL